ncbi:uncharacterized protein DUF5060 [Rathayibacter sp. PhB152]|uniref:apiosidase-like domain-containing protein n=1 Tax=Rathayibacter sp. PhB152 TaxID=2485190 RepID=UPI000F4B5864|nr:DUF4038 domain-containing protein [Rathayibacter sp. PhB152]ROQ64160.1 uncharacterized protein DUF5060 [Rathayibacter sp. PhB152]
MIAVGGVLELTFTGPEERIPADRTPLTVLFRHAEISVGVPGFWDGDNVYRVRFSPPLEGEWSWRASSEAAELDGVSGSFASGPRESPGAIGVVDAHHFAHADGTPFRPVGATVYNWLHQPDERLAATVTAIADAGFTKLRFLVFPQAGDRVEHVPDLLPFEKDADGHWDASRPVVAFFQRLDRAVAALDAHSIQADVLMLNAYDSAAAFGLDGLTEEQDAAYLRYLVARLSAAPNVWWSLCNEFDLLPRPVERWTRAGELVAAVDPHQRLRSIHQWMEFYDHNKAWVTHASIQNGAATEEFGRASLYRDAYRKPVVLDEIKYEGDIPDRWGRLSGEELVHRFWVATVAGCYASHGESFVTESGSLHMVEGGELRGTSPARLGFLRGILDELVVPGLDPIDRWDDPAYVAGVARRQYLQYLGRSSPSSWTFRLPQGNTGERLEPGDAFEVDVIDTWAMTVTPAGRRFVLGDVQRNDAYAVDGEVALPEGEALVLRITRVG